MNDFNIAREASVYRVKTNVIMERIEQEWLDLVNLDM